MNKDQLHENKTIILKDGRRLGYAEYGDAKGKPIFFFHGWPSSRFQGSVTHNSAKKLGIRIISPDRPGYGLSDFKKNRTLLDWPDDVIELANQLGIAKFSVVGVSGGGPYAAVCAYKIPERLINVGIVVGLAPTDIEGVLEGMAIINKLAWRFYHRFPWLRTLAALIHLSQARKIIPNFFSVAFRSNSDRKIMSKKVKQDIAKNRDEAYKQGKEGTAMDLKIYTDDWGFLVNKIKSEVFLWYGEKDKNVSVNMGKYYASKIKKSKLVIYPNEGHFLIRRHVEEILNTLVTK